MKKVISLVLAMIFIVATLVSCGTTATETTTASPETTLAPETTVEITTEPETEAITEPVTTKAPETTTPAYSTKAPEVTTQKAEETADIISHFDGYWCYTFENDSYGFTTDKKILVQDMCYCSTSSYSSIGYMVAVYTDTKAVSVKVTKAVLVASRAYILCLKSADGVEYSATCIASLTETTVIIIKDEGLVNFIDTKLSAGYEIRGYIKYGSSKIVSNIVLYTDGYTTPLKYVG